MPPCASLLKWMVRDMCVLLFTFQDYCRQIDPDSEEEEVAEVEMAGLRTRGAASEEDDDEFGDSADQEWRPKAKAKKARRSSKATAHGDNANDEEEEEEIVEPEEMSKFAEELRQTSRQQLGKKRQRVGVAPR